MDEQPRKSPEAAPEVGPEAPGSRSLTMPAIGALLGMSERAARDWIRRHDLPVHGSRPMRVSEQAVLAQMAAEERVARKSPEVPPEAPGSLPEAPGSTEPIEVAYRVAGEATPEVALVPLTTMVEELRGLAAQLNDMARRNEALALEVGQLRERQVGQAAQLTAKDETIAELRRRAEMAEAERERLQQAQEARRERAKAHVLGEQQSRQVRRSGALLPDALDRTADMLEWRDAHPAPPPPPPTPWARLRAFLRGAD